MPDRADYLARTILSRLRQIDASIAEDDTIGGGRGRNLLKEEAVAKILAVEEGIVDGSVISLVAEAAPVADVGQRAFDRDRDEFAGFLRSRLKL